MVISREGTAKLLGGISFSYRGHEYAESGKPEMRKRFCLLVLLIKYLSLELH